MEITTVITEKVKDVFALGKSIAKVVKEEVDTYMSKDEDEDEDFEMERSSYNHDEERTSLKEYIAEFETKAKEMIQGAFSGFKSSKKEDQKELEARISALEEKLSKLVEESLESFRKDGANRI